MDITGMKMTRRRFAALAGTSIIAAPAIIGRARAADLIPLKLTVDAVSVVTTPTFYGINNKIFERYGLDVTLSTMGGGGPMVTQAIVGGSVDIAQNGYIPVVAAAIQGADVVFIGDVSSKLPYHLVVKKGVTAADLKGRKIAISSFGSTTDVALTYALTKLGLKRSDVTTLQLGGEGTRTAALMSGQIDGSMEQLPRVAELEKSGRFETLVDITEVAGDYPNTGCISRRSFVKNNRDLVKKFTMGVSDSMHGYKTDKAGACKAIATFLKIPNNEAVEQTWESFSKDVFPDIPYPSSKGIQLVLNDLAKKNPKAATTKPAELCDTSIIDELVAEGFYKKLLGKA